MSFLSKWFSCRKSEVRPIQSPDDTNLDRAMKRAKRANHEAVQSFVKEARKQKRDAEFARHVIHEVLDRAERLRAMPDDASIKK